MQSIDQEDIHIVNKYSNLSAWGKQSCSTLRVPYNRNAWTSFLNLAPLCQGIDLR